MMLQMQSISTTETMAIVVSDTVIAEDMEPAMGMEPTSDTAAKDTATTMDAAMDVAMEDTLTTIRYSE